MFKILLLRVGRPLRNVLFATAEESSDVILTVCYKVGLDDCKQVNLTGKT
jgi:hypothetical protein